MKTSMKLLFLLICGINLQAQDGFDVTIQDKEALPVNITLKADSSLFLEFKIPELESLFDKYKIVNFKKFSQLTKHPLLNNVYRIETKEFALADELLEKFPEKFTDVYPWYEPVPFYDPNDYALETNDNTDLDLIRAKDAWEISKGNSNIIIGISDWYIKPDHEDLEDDIHSILNNGNPNHKNTNHGTSVSFCAAGVTDNNIGLSSIGFNTSIMFNSKGYGELLDLAEAGAHIVNASWGNCYYKNGYDDLAIQQIDELGVIITAAAGNGTTTKCSCPFGGGHKYQYPASLDHVISVTSVGHLRPYGEIDSLHGKIWWADCHEDKIDDPGEVHTHNDRVDICAPGYAVRTAKIDKNCNETYGASWGSSFASAMVAGVCALMLDVNPYLTPDEVEDILKSTAFDLNTIPENAKFTGLLGAGRINAYAAVNAARELNVTYATLPYSTGFETGLDENWTMYESHRHGRCVRSSDHSPHSGSYHITMDVIENNNHNTNEAWMHLNLSGKSDVELEFWWKETLDETHEADGVYISDDGGDSFTKIYNLSGASRSYSKVTIDLSDEISTAGLSHSSNFVVKFQQYDNYTMSIDGIAIDDINVCAKPSQPYEITSPDIHCVNEWEEYSCSVVPNTIEYDWYSPIAIIREDGTRYVDVITWNETYYTLKVRAKNECGQYSDWNSSSIWKEDCYWQAESGEDMFIVYPNPANDYVTVSMNKDMADESEKTNQRFTVHVFNQYGNLVISEETKGDLIRINTDHLPNGSYIFRIALKERLMVIILH
ncbi:MAG: S8 family serine peptidase [Bacteroidota bacterium]